jgi:hypothetical protein
MLQEFTIHKLEGTTKTFRIPAFCIPTYLHSYI